VSHVYYIIILSTRKLKSFQILAATLVSLRFSTSRHDVYCKFWVKMVFREVSVCSMKFCGAKKYLVLVCFENPVLCTGSQKETLALSCSLCLMAFGRETKPPVSRMIVSRQVPRKPRLVGGDESAQFINNQI